LSRTASHRDFNRNWLKRVAAAWDEIGWPAGAHSAQKSLLEGRVRIDTHCEKLNEVRVTFMKQMSHVVCQIPGHVSNLHPIFGVDCNSIGIALVFGFVLKSQWFRFTNS